MSEGWIKLNRSLLNNAAWCDCTPVQNRILITLMLNAAYKPQKRIINGTVIELKKGQLATTLNKIVDMCRCEEVTKSKVRTALKLFEAVGIIDTETKENCTVITIKADDDTENDTAYRTGADSPKAAETADEDEIFDTAMTQGYHGDDTEITQGYHGSDTTIAPIKEINNKEFKKDKNIRMCEGKRTHKQSAPTLEQVRLFIDENGIKADAERFFYHYESVGWMMGKTPVTDWRAALRKWSVNGLELSKTAPQSIPDTKTSFQQRVYDEDELERIFENKLLS